MQKGDWFEDFLAARARHELLTLAVWIAALVLAIMAARRWQQMRVIDFRTGLPLFHLLPWLTAHLQRKKWFKVTVQGDRGVLAEDAGTQAALRLLWTGYAVLVFVEFALY